MTQAVLERPVVTEIVLERAVNRKQKLIIILLHVLAVAGAVPLFSWFGLGVFFLFWFITGLGITVGYHRLLTHGSFQTYKWVRATLALMGASAGEGSPISWVAMHRRHHDCADTEGDPHSPTLYGFWFAHAGWLWAYKKSLAFFRAYAPKLMQEPFMQFLSRWYLGWHLALIVLLGGAGYIWRGWFGVASLIEYGVFLRLVVVLNVTWLVNSACHLWGYRNYETDDDSRNLWWVGLLAFGEGWHNNHHEAPTLAQHGHRKWEIDVSYWFILLLEKLRLAWNVKKLQSSQ